PRGRMFFVRVVVRLFALVVALGLGGGSALLDGCVVSCRPESGKNARTGHCHTVPGSPTDSHVQEIPRCCHDGPSGLDASNDGHSRLMAGSFAVMVDNPLDGRDRHASGQVVPLRHASILTDSRPTPLRL